MKKPKSNRTEKLDAVKTITEQAKLFKSPNSITELDWEKQYDALVKKYYPEKKVTKASDHFGDPYVRNENGESVKASELLKDHGIKNLGYGQDSVNFIPNVSSGYLAQVNNLLINNTFMGWAELSLLAQNPLINTVCKVKADECTSKWIEFIAVDTEENKEDKIKELLKEFERLNVKEMFNRSIYLSYLMGGCMLYPKLAGDEHDGEREKALIVDDLKIAKGDLEYLQVIEPLYYVAINYVTDNPFSEWFYKPEKYVVLGMTTHESRLCKFIINEAPTLLKPNYLFNGIPLAQQLIPFTMNFETIRTEIVKIVQRFNTSVLKTNLLALLSDSSHSFVNSASLANRLRSYIAAANNFGVLAIDKDSEEFQQLTISLHNLEELQAQAAEFVCLISRIPATKLFGTPAKGFNATGEHDMKNFYDTVRADQEHFSPHMTKLMHLAMLNIWGKIDPHIGFIWANLEQANEFQDSQIRLNLANEIAILIQNGVITPEQAAERLVNDENSGWDGLEILEDRMENEIDMDDPVQTNKNDNPYEVNKEIDL